MAAAVLTHTASDSLTHGVPEPVRDMPTKRITVQNTEPPVMSLQAEVVDVATRAALATTKQWFDEWRNAEPKSGGVRSVDPTARFIGAIALAAILVAVVAHQIGNTDYEKQQALSDQSLQSEIEDMRRDQATEIAALRAEVTAANSEFRAEMAAQRRATFVLIDALAKGDLDVRSAERELQR